jgi:uncharacterized protein YlxW (UPF0749 family)
MAASTEPRSGLFYGWALGENGWNTGMDANLLRLGRFGFHLSVKNRTQTAPPATPSAGDSYIIASGATGAWAGHDGAVAVFDGSAWVYGTPRTGWRAYDEGDEVSLIFKGGVWAVQTSYTDEQVRDVIGAALAAGTGVTVTVDDSGNTITIAVDTSTEAERIRDVIAAALVAGDGISIVVNDASDTITITNAGGSGGGSYTDEQVRDVIGAALVAGSGITITVNDAGDTITIASTAAYTDEQARDAIGAALVAGTGIAVTVNDGADTITIATNFDKARAYLNTATNTTTAGWQKVPVDTVEFDTNSIFDTTNKRFIPKKAGYYQVNLRARTGTTGTLVLAIGKNGTQVKAAGDDIGSAYALGGSTLIYCNGTTDYLEMFVYTTAARAYTTGSFDTFVEVFGPF